MKIGIGLPNPIPGLDGRLLPEWSRRAEAAGFSTLATIDRIAYPSHDSLASLAAAAAVTERIGLLTNILLAPTRNAVLLAKEAASLDRISGGRFTLGLGVGARPDDFEASGTPFGDRGERFDRMLEVLHEAWSGKPVEGAGKPVGPPPTRERRVPILMGGTTDRAIERTVRWAVGWTAGGSAADRVGPFAERVRAAWREAGREGEPHIAALTYFSLGEDHTEESREYILDYYGAANWARAMADAVPRTPEAIREATRRFEDAGVDELFLDPTVANVDQVELLAEVVL